MAETDQLLSPRPEVARTAWYRTITRQQWNALVAAKVNHLAEQINPSVPVVMTAHLHVDECGAPERAGRKLLTVDAPVLGHRPRDERNRFALPEGMAMANLPSQLPEPSGESGGGPGSGLAALFTDHGRSLTVDDLDWIRRRSGLPLVVKGVHRADDARRCVEAGADAVVVSNHGGRQLDGAPSSIRVLPEIVDAVAGRTEVWFDGGIRSGQDVLRALALGARGTLIGRSFAYGLGAMGEAVRAIPHCESGIALYDPSRHASQAFAYGGHNAGACCGNHLARARWSLGYPERAAAAIRRTRRRRAASSSATATASCIRPRSAASSTRRRSSSITKATCSARGSLTPWRWRSWRVPSHGRCA